MKWISSGLREALAFSGVEDIADFGTDVGHLSEIKYMAPPETSHWDAVGPILVFGLLAIWLTFR
jgi:hypothetical protein